MNPAPLQLEGYFVTELRFTANANFDAQAAAALRLEDFRVAVDCQPTEKTCWNVLLRLTYEPEVTANIPCHFHLGVFGSFRVADGYPADEIERLVRTNGPSILYSLSREITRSVTIMGPMLALSLPPMSFYQPAAPVKNQPKMVSETPGASAKKRLKVTGGKPRRPSKQN